MRLDQQGVTKAFGGGKWTSVTGKEAHCIFTSVYKHPDEEDCFIRSLKVRTP